MRRILFSLCILSIISVAQAKESRTLDINTLNFSNRADCALDSQKPTRSVFFIADTLDVGKSLLRAGDMLSKSDNFTAEGVKRYRFTLQSLSKLVAEKLLKGELPLLNSKLPDFSDTVERCREGCFEMDQLVAQAWSGTLQGERLNFPASHLSCHEVKDFAALYPHLLDSKPNKDSLKALGESMTQASEHLVECNIDNPGDLSVSFYQFDLRHIDPKLWNKVGFDFWSSFNIYFSWAFRHSPEARQMGLNYHGLFRQVNLEELSFFFSNGCHSISKAECSKDFLNTNSLRELSRVSQDADLAKLQVFMPSPDQDHDDILRQNDGSGREDLSLDAHESATDWAKNFKDNMAKTRGFIRLKLSQSLAQLKFIRRGLEERLLTDIALELESVKNAEQAKRAEAFTFCAELTSAMDREISFIRPKLAAMTQYESIWNYSRNIHADIEDDLEWSLSTFAPQLISVCEKLRVENVWGENDHPGPEYFSAWYQSFHYKKVIPFEGSVEGDSYLLLKNGQTGKSETFCKSSLECGKKLITNLIDLKISSDYASSLLSLDGQIKSISATSSMSERVACQMYDPWAQSKKAGFDFLKDMVLAGISAATIVPVYVDVSIAQKKVSSLEEIIKDGKVYYNPKFDRRSIQKTLIIDFGPLIGAPCAIGVSGDARVRPPSYLAFEGITLQSCRDNERINVTAESPEQIENAVRKLSGCFTCTISLASTLTSVGTLNPLMRPFFYVIRGVVKLVSNLKSPEDIPRSWSVNPNAVARTLKLNGGEIPKSCVRKLSRGEECIKDSCIRNIATSLDQHFKLVPDSIQLVKGGLSLITIGERQISVKTPRRGCSRHSFTLEDFEQEQL
jgi:hypothetical protein